jgi:2-oxoglutarate ferredoxin oxidoreductase subunit alpha
MNAGQMLEDVNRIVRGRLPVRFLGRMGGLIPFPDEIAGALTQLAQETQGG